MSIDTMAEELLLETKIYLSITWEDTNTDMNLKNTLKRGMMRLQKIAGVSTLDFKEEDLPKSLLLDYCRYSNSNALEMFEKNFSSELMSLHIEGQVSNSIAESEVITP